MIYTPVTTDEIGSNLVRVTLVLPGIKKKKFEQHAANADVDVKYDERLLYTFSTFTCFYISEDFIFHICKFFINKSLIVTYFIF